MKDKLKLCYQATNNDELLFLCSFVDPCFMLSVVPSEVESKRDCGVLLFLITTQEIYIWISMQLPNGALKHTRYIIHTAE